jgi:hypothetical protein
MALKYCIECYLEKDESEFAKGSYFCRRCKERYNGELYLEPEPSIHKIFERLDREMAQKKPANVDNRLDKIERKELKKAFKKRGK